MAKYVIERRVSGIGASSTEEFQSMAQVSNKALAEMSPGIQWLESFIVDDMSYCIYIAPDEEAIREHALRSGFPADRISRIRAILDPSTAEE
ncbi:MAG: DUF4242 domain-containing protein [Anaerolineae bacterium]|nr:DUF4242 domain-containing protein [Anaerolineae bacterium]